MKLVIDITDEMWQAVQDGWVGNELWHSALKNGTPLPKGHGDLKDESDLDLFAPNLGTDEYVDELMAKHNIDYVNGDDEDKVKAFALDLIDSCMNVIKTAPTIIEAESEVEEEW